MNFLSSIRDGFIRYADFSGVSTRTQFWFWLLFVVIALCFSLIVDGAYLGPLTSSFLGQEDVMAFDQDAAQPLTFLMLIAFALPTAAVSARRMHDVGFSAWWLLTVITIIALVPLFLLLMKGRKKTSNIYVERPNS